MDKIRANIPSSSQYERPSAVPFISQEALEIAALPYEKFIKPAFEGMNRIGGKLVDAAAGRDVWYTSEDLAAFVDTMVGPGILAGPSGAGVAGVIRQPEAVAKYLRKLMRAERNKWGKPEPGDVFGEVLRQPLYRGQATIPEPFMEGGKPLLTDEGVPVFGHGDAEFVGTPTLEYSHTKARNFGEPGYSNPEGGPARGVSMSTDPQIARGFSHRGDKISRVLPLYGGRPEDVILNAVNPEHQKVLKEVYGDTVKTLFDMGRIAHPGYRPFTYRDLRDNVDANEFNRINTEKLLEKGYKGILHSPHRYNKERELQMFRGEDVIHIDEFPHDSPDVQRLWGASRINPKQHKAQTLADAYFELAKKKHMLPIKDTMLAKAEAFAAEAREAADVPRAMLGTHKKRQERWDKKTAGDMLGFRQGALGVLYKDIDLDSLFSDTVKKYKPGYKPPKAPKPKWDNADTWDALLAKQDAEYDEMALGETTLYDKSTPVKPNKTIEFGSLKKKKVTK